MAPLPGGVGERRLARPDPGRDQSVGTWQGFRWDEARQFGLVFLIQKKRDCRTGCEGAAAVAALLAVVD
jgi:hypothetical protein